MIKLIRLNGRIIYINFIQIKYVECIPETKVMMMDGEYYLVKDSVESIVERCKGFFNPEIEIREVK